LNELMMSLEKKEQQTIITVMDGNVPRCKMLRHSNSVCVNSVATALFASLTQLVLGYDNTVFSSEF
jgi:hypothetical protein